MKSQNTSWGAVASWYDEHLEKNDTYHLKVVLPNLSRLVAPKKGQKILDIACGEGFFSRAFAEAGAEVWGMDISPELISLAEKKNPTVKFSVSASHELNFDTGFFDKATCVLAIQNIEKARETFIACADKLARGGSFFVVMNHPMFRIPKATSWGWDEKNNVQYRRVDAYMSENKSIIDMHPGTEETTQTISFHRPLQYYVKAAASAGLIVSRLEEWISHRESEVGPRKEAEDTARKEIPLFMCIEFKKQ